MAKILLVEDNEMNREMLTKRLRRDGFDILVAADGAAAVEAAREGQPDLILMDMSIPVLDGWEATRRIRDLPQTCCIPVIGLSAHAMSRDREQAIQAGCNDYETKPVVFASLLEKIHRLLGS